MHTCTHIYAHTHTYTPTHTCTRIYAHRHTYIHMHTYIRTQTHTHTYTPTHTCTRIYAHAHRHTYTHSRVQDLLDDEGAQRWLSGLAATYDLPSTSGTWESTVKHYKGFRVTDRVVVRTIMYLIYYYHRNFPTRISNTLKI